MVVPKVTSAKAPVLGIAARARASAEARRDIVERGARHLLASVQALSYHRTGRAVVLISINAREPALAIAVLLLVSVGSLPTIVDRVASLLLARVRLHLRPHQYRNRARPMSRPMDRAGERKR